MLIVYVYTVQYVYMQGYLVCTFHLWISSMYYTYEHCVCLCIVHMHNFKNVYMQGYLVCAFLICGSLPYTTHISIVYVYILYMCILWICVHARGSSICILKLWIFSMYYTCKYCVCIYIVCVHNAEYVYMRRYLVYAFLICGSLPCTTHVSIVYAYILYVCIMLNMCTCKGTQYMHF